ncbi:MAG: tetratricopeptide repeat protein [Thermodesulfobacteriota bacterium]
MRIIPNHRRLIHLSVLIAICLAVFANTLANDFVWEDTQVVSDNPHIRSLRNIPLFFTARHWREDRSSSPDTGFRPIRETSFAVDYRLGGLQPIGFHLTNMLLHVVNVVLAYFLALMLTATGRGEPRGEDAGQKGFLSPAFLAALFFALHPVHVESVAYIKNRSDLLAFAFYQAAFLLYLLHRSRTGKTNAILFYCASLLGFMGALGSKPMAATLPLILALYVVCFPGERPAGRRFAGLIPFFGLALIWFWLQKDFLIAAGSDTTGFDPGSRRHIWTILATLGWYLDKLVWPAPLSIAHLFHPPRTLLDPAVLLTLATLAALLLVMVRTFSAQRSMFFGLAWVLITLLPVANILVLELRPIAEQRLYILSFGFCLVLGLIFSRIPALIKRTGISEAMAFRLSWVTAGIICAVYGTHTVQRNLEWRDSVSLFESAVRHSPDLAWAHNNLANALKETGRLDEALDHYRRALALKPDQPLAHNNIGAILGEQGKLDEAVVAFEAALRLQPHQAMTIDNLGLAFIRQGRLADGIEYFRKAVVLEPQNALYHVHLAEALAITGRLEEAVDQYRAVLSLRPGDGMISRRLAALLSKINQTGAGTGLGDQP